MTANSWHPKICRMGNTPTWVGFYSLQISAAADFLSFFGAHLLLYFAVLFLWVSFSFRRNSFMLTLGRWNEVKKDEKEVIWVSFKLINFCMYGQSTSVCSCWKFNYFFILNYLHMLILILFYFSICIKYIAIWINTS